MVDQQTPEVKSEDEIEDEKAAPPEVRERRDDSGDLEVERNREAQSDTRPAPDSTAASGPARDVAGDSSRQPTPDAGTSRSDAALFDRDATQGYQDRWLVIQTEFVDEPRKAVEKAESLVGEVMTALTEGFAREHRDLEARWSGDREVSTEDLRLTIRRYRSFFNRLLSL